MSKFTRFFLFFSGLALGLQAQDRQLDEVTVTANRTDQKLSHTGKVVVVLTDSVLQKYATQSVAELLSRQTGFQINGANGPQGSQQDVYFRGAGTGNLLVLIDGIPVYDPSGIANTFDFNLLTVGECDRIEILRGTQSTLYGSDAVAGVVNIITRKNSRRPIEGAISLQGGSYGTFRGGIGLNGAIGKGSFQVRYTRQSTNGFSSARDTTGKAGFDRDGFRSDNLLAAISLPLSSRLLWKARGLYSHYRTDVDAGAFADEKDFTFRNTFRSLATGIEFSHRLGKLTANYSISDYSRRFVDDSTWVAPGAYNTYSRDTYDGVAQYAEVYHTLRVNKQLQVVAGIDFRAQNTDQAYVSYSSFGEYRSTPIDKDTARTRLLSGYLTALFRTETGLAVELGGRYNHHSLYGNNFTWSFNPSYLLMEKLKIFVNVSTGFRAPSLYQLYSVYGNKGLRPEKSTSFEGGAAYGTERSQLRVVYFDRQIKDVFVFQSMSVDPYGRYVNFDKQHDHGVEVEGRLAIGKLSLSGNATFLTGKVQTKNETGKDTTFFNLFRRPKQLFNLTAGYQVLPELFVSASLRSVGDRKEQYYNGATYKTDIVRLDAYTTIDVYAEYRITPRLRVYGDVRNLFDQTYADQYGFNTRRRNAAGGLQLTF
jgi:vitamin B12 transporter